MYGEREREREREREKERENRKDRAGKRGCLKEREGEWKQRMEGKFQNKQNIAITAKRRHRTMNFILISQTLTSIYMYIKFIYTNQPFLFMYDIQ